MLRIFAALLGMALLSGATAGCATDTTPEEQNEVASKFRSMQPGRN